MLFGSNGLESVKENNTVVAEELSPEALSFIMETAIMESASPEDLEIFLESHMETSAAVNEEVLLEKSIVRLDKQAKISRAQKVAVFTIAKEKNDPQFKKLLTVWRMERFLENALFKKYGNEGYRRARKSVESGGRSKSQMVKKAAKNVAKQLNGVR